MSTEHEQTMAALDELMRWGEAPKRLHAETAAKLDTLLPALLDRAFKGEL